MIASVDLLRKLASGVRPDGASTPSGSKAIEREHFDHLLERVQTGDLSRGAPVHLARDSDLEIEPDLMERLADATDEARASGAERLLAWVDGHVLRVDVNEREAHRAEDGATEGGLLRGFDAAVVISRDAPEPRRIIPGPGGLANAALAEVLARGVRDGDAATDNTRAVG